MQTSSLSCRVRPAGRPSRLSISSRPAPRLLAAAARAQAPQAEEGRWAAGARAAAAAGLAAILLIAGSASAAGLDTGTSKAGLGAKVEASDISKQSGQEVVRKLKDEVLPEAEEKLSAEAARSGSSYPQSVVQELKTVKGEVEALAKEAAETGGRAAQSNVKSAASGIEQQINALKGILGFD